MIGNKTNCTENEGEREEEEAVKYILSNANERVEIESLAVFDHTIKYTMDPLKLYQSQSDELYHIQNNVFVRFLFYLLTFYLCETVEPESHIKRHCQFGAWWHDH